MKFKNFILTLLIVLSVLSPINTNAQEIYNYDYEYNIENGFVTLTKYLGTETNVVIPEQIEKLPIKSLVGTFSDNNMIKSVIIPNTVTNIGDRTFYQCVNLSKIKFSTDLETIGNYAFYATNIKNITFPEQLQFIGSYAFYGCENLKYIKFTSQSVFLSDYAFYNTNLKTVEDKDSKINSDITSLPDEVIYTHDAFSTFLARSNTFRRIFKVKDQPIKSFFLLLFAVVIIICVFLFVLLILKLIRLLSGNKKKKYLKYLKQYEHYTRADSNIMKAYPNKNNYKKFLLLLSSIIAILIWFYLFGLCWLFIQGSFNILNYPLNYIIYVILATIVTIILIILIAKITIKIKSHQNIKVRKSKRKNQND